MKKLGKWAIAATLISVFSVPVAVLAQPPATQSQMGEKGERRERHPAIRQAIAALEKAKADMQKANHDFGGHRESALRACDEAINQLKQALNYDKK